MDELRVDKPSTYEDGYYGEPKDIFYYKHIRLVYGNKLIGYLKFKRWADIYNGVDVPYEYSLVDKDMKPIIVNNEITDDSKFNQYHNISGGKRKLLRMDIDLQERLTPFRGSIGGKKIKSIKANRVDRKKKVKSVYF